jgi:hypothetical protein
VSWPILLLGAVLGALLVLFLQGRRNERATTRDWVPLLTPGREALVKREHSRLQDGLTLADVAYDRAATLRELGSVKEARQLLKVGYGLIDRFAPDLFRLLAMMTVYSRMVSAVVPVSPMRPERFRTTGVSVLVRFAVFAHHLLVDSAERFRFRLYVIGQSARLLLRGLARATARLAGRPEPEQDEVDWEHLHAIRSDFRALTDESIESLRTLLASLDASRR